MNVKGSSPAVRVAAVATAAITVVYVLGALVFNLAAARHMTGNKDDQLGDRLRVVRHQPDALGQQVARGHASSTDLDADGPPVFLWAVNDRRTVVAHSPGAPVLPPALLTAAVLRNRNAVTANLGGSSPYRVRIAAVRGGWLIAGENLADNRHTQSLLLEAEVIAPDIRLSDAASAEINAAHRRIVEAVAARKAGEARAIMAAHIEEVQASLDRMAASA